MRLSFRRNDSPVGIVIISGSCCIPGMAAIDEQARRIVEQAISETGIEARVKMMPATTAYFGGAPREVIAKLINDSQAGQLGLPAILINGKAVSYGMPKGEDIKSALLQAMDAKKAEEESTNE